jgi:hypothetical protein
MHSLRSAVYYCHVYMYYAGVHKEHTLGGIVHVQAQTGALCHGGYGVTNHSRSLNGTGFINLNKYN